MINGEIAEAVSIGYFTKQGYTVLLPVTNTQAYDIVVNKGDEYIKVNVKCAYRKDRGNS